MTTAGAMIFFVAVLLAVTGLVLLIGRRTRNTGKWSIYVALISIIGSVVLILSDPVPDQDAKKLGFASAADRHASQVAGFMEAAAWIEAKTAKAKSESERSAELQRLAAEQEALRKAEAERKAAERATQLAESSRLAAERAAQEKARADQQAAEQAERRKEESARKAAEEQAEQRRQADAARAEEEKCRSDIKCLGEKKHIEATFACRDVVQSLAKYDYKWVDGWTDVKFSRYRWLDRTKAIITYVGDQIQFQNGLGNWVRHTYYCDYDSNNKLVLDVRASPGRL